MPRFELVSIQEATLKTATGKRAQIAREYLGYIDRLEEGQAGRLQASEGETTTAIRRRVGAAAKLAGKDIVIRRSDEEVYFWVEERPRQRRTRGRGGTGSD